MVNVQTAIDAEGKYSANIPAGTAFVGAYVSGTGDVPWTPDELAKVPAGSLIRIYQGSGVYPGVRGYDELDVESEAVTVAQAASEIEKRIQNGIQWTVIYGSESTITAVASAVVALGSNYFPGHLAAFLADWDLNQQQAEARLGTSIGGIGVVGVQWASPTSNPKTIAPGSNLTLAQANIDLSVVDADFWNRYKAPPTPPPPPPPAVLGMVVWEPSSTAYASEEVESADGGKTWTKVQ